MGGRDSMSGNDRPPNTSDKTATIRRILDAAYEVFGDRGLELTTMEAIAERAQLSKQLIYHYFGNKEGLYVEVLNAHLRMSHAPVLDFDYEALPPLDAIRKLFELGYDWHLRHAHSYAIDQLSANSKLDLSDSGDQRYGQRTTEIIEQIIRRGQADGSIRQDIEPLFVHVLIWVLNVGFLSSRQLFERYMGADFSTPAATGTWRELSVEAIIAVLAVGPRL